MLTEPTREKLALLRLTAMADAWEEQRRDARSSELPFDERFGMLVEAEHAARHNRRLTRLLKDAELRIANASLEAVECSTPRGLEKAMDRQLAQASWVNDHLNVLITGPTGVGKSYLASAIGQGVCRRGLRVLFRRVPRLFEELGLAKASGTYAKTLAKVASADVLVLDDLGIQKITEAERMIGDPTAADAILDRLVHNAYKLELKGASRRKEITK